jgi:hypothetical protein
MRRRTTRGTWLRWFEPPSPPATPSLRGGSSTASDMATRSTSTQPRRRWPSSLSTADVKRRQQIFTRKRPQAGRSSGMSRSVHMRSASAVVCVRSGTPARRSRSAKRAICSPRWATSRHSSRLRRFSEELRLRPRRERSSEATGSACGICAGCVGSPLLPTSTNVYKGHWPRTAARTRTTATARRASTRHGAQARHTS